MGLVDRNSSLSGAGRPANAANQTESALQTRTTVFQQIIPNLTYYQSKVQFKSTNPAIDNTLLYFPRGYDKIPTDGYVKPSIYSDQYILTEFSDFIITENGDYLITGVMAT